MNSSDHLANLECDRIRQMAGHYRTERHNLARDFFGPCLAAFCRYRRAAGFFSSSALRTWAECLPRLALQANVRIQLLISPELSPGDARTLTQAVNDEERERLLAGSVEHFVRDVFEFQHTSDQARGEALRGQLLAWLIVQGRLELRFAVNMYKGRETGIFHKKIGVFDYPWGDRIAFTGSANESTSAHEVNSESVEVYRSWIASDVERIENKIEEFEEAWSARCPNLKVLPLSAEALRYIHSIAPNKPPNFPEHIESIEPAEPSWLATLWPHQRVALDRFLAVGHGILEMATGTGKTRTALACAAALRDQREINALIITMEGTDLLKQWYGDLCSWAEANGFRRVFRHYENFHEKEKFLLNPGLSILLASRSNLSTIFRELRIEREIQALIIHDEVHDLGSPANIATLAGQPELFPYRLGLSATPDREYDADGNAFIEREIGPILYSFGIEAAITNRILCPFDYVALPYQLTIEDKEDRRKIYQQEAAAKARGEPWNEQKLWIELSKVYKKARMKVSVFGEFLVRKPPEFLRSSIIFVEDRAYAERIYPLIHARTHSFHSYFADEDAAVLHSFARGEYDCLLTCHKVSQGIDVPSLEKVVLFSSARSRLETIQRLGRCLRVDRAKPEKVATVVDFVLAGDDNTPDHEGVDFERWQWFQHLSKIRPDP